MNKKMILISCLVGLVGVTGVAAQEIPGVNAEAIEKRAQEGGAAASDFVKQILERASHQNPDADQVAKAAYQSVENAPDSLKRGTIAGADMASVMGSAGHQGSSTGGPVFLAFASTSMPEQSLKRMIEDVSKAGGMVVFRGVMPDGSKTFLAQLQKVLSADQSSHVILDPRLFRAFGVQEVPTYVAVSRSFDLCDQLDCVSQPTAFDKLSGNVTAQYALQTFADGKGPGTPVALSALAKLEHAE